MFPVSAAPTMGAKQNGLDTVAFDGSVGMTVPNSSGAISGDLTAFVVVKTNQAGTYNTIFGNAADTVGKWDDDVDWGFGTNVSDKCLFNVTANSGATGVQVNADCSIGDYHVLSGVWDSGDHIRIWVDGQFVTEKTFAVVLGNEHPLSVGGYAVIRRLKGNIGEAIAYDSALSDDQRAAVEQYLLDKWIP
jgi:hypothetical protein